MSALSSILFVLQELLACILDKLQGLLVTLSAQGFGPLQEAYLQAWLHTNQQVCRSTVPALHKSKKLANGFV